ncbi:hypothetical protein EDL98_00510 [Ornithobacterium rhinotracheale]|uniref:metallophosphoesterase n=1 Tax=Ornithobacterium rhinotracheale TaxID=28251 RepID=UPI00129C8E49|nr:metallophosphoesterase [Ornithobacterium rhinotracheale]MRJ09573.1 hypothetical protein [Ornithobacterium rhinotracheale]
MPSILYKNIPIFAISDTHGAPFSIPKNTEIIIFAGDMGAYTLDETRAFLQKLGQHPAPLKIFVPGNHDLVFDLSPKQALSLLPKGVVWLRGSMQYKGIRFCAAAAAPWLHQPVKIPENTDFLITHGPPKGILDDEQGCALLRQAIEENPPKFHIFGHIHQAKGEWHDTDSGTRFMNVSFVD